MIECPTCKVSFNPRHQVCPRCGVYRAKLEDRLEHLAYTAQFALDRGDPPEYVESMLVEDGVPPLVAHEIVCERARKVRQAARSSGCLRLLGGLGLMGVGAFLVMLWLVTAGILWLALSLLAAASGVVLAAFGLSSVLTGHDSAAEVRKR